VTLPLAAMPRSVAVALAIVVAVFLAWRAIVAGVGAIAERGVPTGVVDAGASPADSSSESSLRKRLAKNPGDALALLLLALELERQGKREEAGAAMGTAARLAPADPQALLLIAGYFLRTGEETAALSTLRRALDSAPAEVSIKIWPVFTAALVSGRHQKYFDAMARENAPWWPEFFRHACARAVPANAVQAVFAVRVTAGLATVDERQCLIDRLQRDGQWTNAYLLWLNGLPPEQRKRVGYVFNGDFEAPLSNSGFDWRVPPQESTIVSAEPGDGVSGKRGLNVAFTSQRYGGPPVYQTLLLEPGKYQLEGKAKAALEAWLGMQWGVYCLDAAGRATRQLARTDPFTGTTRWREFRYEFAVPVDCPAQLLRLELANPKQGAAGPADVAIRLKGKLWFDDIRVRIVDERAGGR
jgi:tetratricopeptide (TPR) repeat protein